MQQNPLPTIHVDKDSKMDHKIHISSRLLTAAILLAATSLSGCASSIYSVLQMEGLTQCNKIADRETARRCSAAQSMPKEKYDAERARIRGW